MTKRQLEAILRRKANRAAAIRQADQKLMFRVMAIPATK
jgi:hypothetical protein